ncbi:hepatoma-derived growth factor-related protein 2 isoform X1 [Ictalurus punctatus]|uniref:Hepatoma-derived growth factor-related protein 2 isoform X1 n=1 Tax=Ictalurus punctatus TaxID=7998 RepID=A0A2D0SEM3_ICTPU|nr:hepatoma-derived growth factor-related protein 2 isoform X1 [Ictalurus punctatus]
MTGIQSRDESVGDSSDDEPLSKMVKPGKKCPEDAPSDIMEDASPKKTLKEPTSAADVPASQVFPGFPQGSPVSSQVPQNKCPGHSSDDEPLSKLTESKGAKRSSKQKETAAGKQSESEDDQPLTMIIKKKKQKADTEEPEDAKKTRSPKKRKAVTKASKLRDSSPSPSPSPVKATQRRGQKGKDESKKKVPAHSPAVNTTPKRRGRAKKEGKAPCSDSSDDEPLSELPWKRSEPEMKQAVVLVERMSERDVKDAVARGRAHSQEQKSTARAECAAEGSDEEPLSHKMKRLKEQSKTARGRRPAADASSDDEPLVRKVKAAKVKDKFRKRANGEEDTVKQDRELSEEDERPH